MPVSLHQKYVNAVRDIVLFGEANSAHIVMLEAAEGLTDHVNFTDMLTVIVIIARNTVTETPTVDMSVWCARVVLEEQLADIIEGLPTKAWLMAPTALVPVIADYVRDQWRVGRLYDVLDRPAVGFEGGHAHDVEEVPLWPQVYYCMRVGNVPGALLVLQSADPEQHPEAVKVLPYLRRFWNGRHHAICKFQLARRRDAEERGAMAEEEDAFPEGTPMTPGYLVAESDYVALEKFYKEVVWNAGDAYMKAVVVLILRLEVLPSYGPVAEVRGDLSSTGGFAQYPAANKHQKCSPAMPENGYQSVFWSSLEEYMWYRLWVCRTPIESEAMSLLSGFSFVTFEEIQGNILSVGSTYLDWDGVQPLLYVFVLVCCGFYEEAISYLTTQVDELFMHYGVHLAIALYHLGWTKDESKFHTTLMRYVSKFSRLYPVEAATYLLTIRDRQVLDKLLRELVQSTGEYETLLGSARGGTVSHGKIAEMVESATAPLPSKLTVDDWHVLRREIAEQAASEATTRGEFAIAADLYELADKQVEKVEMVMIGLAEVVDMQSSPKRPLAVANARRVLEAIQSKGDLSITSIIPRSLEVLLKMATVFEEYWRWRYGTAWEAIRRAGVLPLNADDISSCQRDLSSPGDKYAPCVQRCAGQVLKVALVIAERALELGCVTSELEASAWEGLDGQFRDPDRSEVKSLCVFTGLMRMTETQVNERLVRVEMLLS